MDYYILVQLMGGLALFIYGMFLLSDSLKKLSLSLLKRVLEKVTSNRIKAILTGAFITSIIQSSSATSVILVGFLNAGILNLAKALPVIIGANIGTTITAQLIAFKITKLTPIFISVGALIFFVSKKNKNKNKGLALLAFGLLFLGLLTMSSSVTPLKDDPALLEALSTFGKVPILGILVGLVVTVIFQSSSTTIGMLISLAIVGLIDLRSAFFIVLGDNIGTCVTAVIASLNGNYASKRLALGHTLFNIIGTAVAYPMVSLYLWLIPLTSSDIARQIANSHTIFNIFNTIIILPFIPLFIKLLKKIIPKKDYARKEGMHLDKNLLSTPPLAIKAVAKEIEIMLSICNDMLHKTEECVITYKHKVSKEIYIDEDSVDEMQRTITRYLIDIIKTEVPDKPSIKIPPMLHSVNDLERVGDYCIEICKSAEIIYEENLALTKASKAELGNLFIKTDEVMKLTKKAISENDFEAARESLEIKKRIYIKIREYKGNHIKRLRGDRYTNRSGLVYSDIIQYILRINGHLGNINKSILT